MRNPVAFIEHELTKKDRNGNCALFCATINDDLDTFSYLFEILGRGCGGMMETKNWDQDNLFHLVGIHRSQNVAAYLARVLGDMKGSDFHSRIVSMIKISKNGSGETALHCIARHDENVEMLCQFEEVGGVLWTDTTSTLAGKSALYVAIQREQFQMADKLLAVTIRNIKTRNYVLGEKRADTMAFEIQEEAMIELQPPTQIRVYVNPEQGRAGLGFVREDELQYYESSFVGTAAMNCSLETLRYLYARGYDFTAPSRRSKMDAIVHRMMRMREGTANNRLYGVSSSFLFTMDIFQRIVTQYSNHYVSINNGKEMKRLIPSLRNLCMRVVVSEQIDTSRVSPFLLLVRDDLSIEQGYRVESECPTDRAVNAAKKREREEMEEVLGEREKMRRSSSV